MKKLLTLFIIIATVATSCKKETPEQRAKSKTCYECSMSDGVFYDVGCMTPDEWSAAHISDSLHRPCRAK